jgi:hypothetical protein
MTERIERKTYRTKNEAREQTCSTTIERFYKQPSAIRRLGISALLSSNES